MDNGQYKFNLDKLDKLKVGQFYKMLLKLREDEEEKPVVVRVFEVEKASNMPERTIRATVITDTGAMIDLGLHTPDEWFVEDAVSIYDRKAWQMGAAKSIVAERKFLEQKEDFIKDIVGDELPYVK